MQRGAFTLIELVFVIMIVGILSMFAIPQFSEVQEGAKHSNTDAFMTQLRSKLIARFGYNGYSELNTSSSTLPYIIQNQLNDNELKTTYTTLSTQKYLSFSSTLLYNPTSTPVVVCVGDNAQATSTACQSGTNDFNLTLLTETKKDLQGRDIVVKTLALTR